MSVGWFCFGLLLGVVIMLQINAVDNAECSARLYEFGLEVAQRLPPGMNISSAISYAKSEEHWLRNRTGGIIRAYC